jgi:hypothetical protein
MFTEVRYTCTKMQVLSLDNSDRTQNTETHNETYSKLLLIRMAATAVKALQQAAVSLNHPTPNSQCFNYVDTFEFLNLNVTLSLTF